MPSLQDGTFMIIGANGDSLFKRLMKAMDREDLAEAVSNMEKGFG